MIINTSHHFSPAPSLPDPGLPPQTASPLCLCIYYFSAGFFPVISIPSPWLKGASSRGSCQILPVLINHSLLCTDCFWGVVPPTALPFFLSPWVISISTCLSPPTHPQLNSGIFTAVTTSDSTPWPCTELSTQGRLRLVAEMSKVSAVTWLPQSPNRCLHHHVHEG